MERGKLEMVSAYLYCLTTPSVIHKSSEKVLLDFLIRMKYSVNININNIKILTKFKIFRKKRENYPNEFFLRNSSSGFQIRILYSIV